MSLEQSLLFAISQSGKQRVPPKVQFSICDVRKLERFNSYCRYASFFHKQWDFTVLKNLDCFNSYCRQANLFMRNGKKLNLINERIVSWFGKTSSPSTVHREFMLHFDIRGRAAQSNDSTSFTLLLNHFKITGPMHKMKRKEQKPLITQLVIQEVRSL